MRESYPDDNLIGRPHVNAQDGHLMLPLRRCALTFTHDKGVARNKLAKGGIGLLFARRNGIDIVTPSLS